MLNKFMKALKLVFNRKMLRALGQLGSQGYLIERGWFQSYMKQMPVEVNGHPLPWLTYPSIMFLQERLLSSMVIFEFGAGNSTLFYSLRVQHIDSVVHNLYLYDELQNRLPPNVNLIYKELHSPNSAYTNSATLSGIDYDVIIIDGRSRVDCIKNSVGALRDDGVIVLDDAERKEYTKGIDFLLERGFKKISFWGISPGRVEEKCTVIFYREKNCLNI